jgi:hypothetical protein
MLRRSKQPTRFYPEWSPEFVSEEYQAILSSDLTTTRD